MVLTVSLASANLRSQQGSLKRFTHRSDPFDLTISESGSRPNLMTIEEVLKNDQAAENAPNIVQAADAVTLANHDEGAVSQAYVTSSYRSRLKSALTRCFTSQDLRGSRVRPNHQGNHWQL